MHLIFFDDTTSRNGLLPFTYTRPVAAIRFGILTLREKWEKVLGISSSFFLTEKYLSKKFPLSVGEENIVINGGVVAEPKLAKALLALPTNTLLRKGDLLIGGKIAPNNWKDFESQTPGAFTEMEFDGTVRFISKPWELFSHLGEAIQEDFALLTHGRTSAKISSTNLIIGNPELIFLEEGAVVEGASLNTTGGPIYLGKNSEVMEGSLIRGPFALGEHSALKLGAKIYGPTAFGPEVKVGGEVNNSLILGYSNKAHDGFLGNAVIGEWCNLGADTNNSNLKNNYDEVKLWSFSQKKFVPTGLQFCGLMMGDHSKCGINTMFNTGTVVGVCANIFGAGFPRNYIPSFSWGGAAGMVTYRIDAAIETAKLVFARRKMVFDEVEEEIFRHLYALEGHA